MDCRCEDDNTSMLAGWLAPVRWILWQKPKCNCTRLIAAGEGMTNDEDNIQYYISVHKVCSLLFFGGLSEEEQGMFDNLPDLKFPHFNLHIVDRPPLS